MLYVKETIVYPLQTLARVCFPASIECHSPHVILCCSSHVGMHTAVLFFSYLCVPCILVLQVLAKRFSALSSSSSSLFPRLYQTPEIFAPTALTCGCIYKAVCYLPPHGGVVTATFIRPSISRDRFVIPDPPVAVMGIACLPPRCSIFRRRSLG